MTSPREHAKTFLSAWGIGLDDLVALLPKPVGEEVILLGGSIPEGLANQEADIDLIILGAPERVKGLGIDDGTLSQSVWHDQRNREINTESWTTEQLTELGERLHASTAGVLRPRADNKLSSIRAFGELRLLHRARFAVPLVNEAGFEQWRRKLHLGLFPEYLCTLRLFEHFNFREDFIGEIEQGRTQSASWISKVVLSELAGALLAKKGETNILLQKWMVPLLQRNASLIGPDVVDSLLYWMSLPISGDLTPGQADQMLTFCDQAIDQVINPGFRGKESLSTLVELVRLKRRIDPSKL